jgi:UDP:flavonoid glycosyltransferase YjiC (YdhE family)
MRFLFATTRGAGHVGPLIPFARAAAAAGHAVLVAGPGSAGGLVRRAGLPFAAVGEPPPAHAARAWAPVWSPETSPGMAAVVQELFIGLHARRALPAMLALVREWQPDVVVRETLEFASALAAERCDVPQVRVGIHLDARTDADDSLLGVAVPALDALRPAVGLAPDPHAVAIARSPVLTLAPASTSGPLDETPRPLRFRDAALAPVAQLSAWGDPAAPLVYVSFGSEAAASHHFPGVYRHAAEALGALPVRTLLTIGDRRDPAELGPLPPSVRVQRWVDQRAVMPLASAVVGHGGSGSTLMALAAGVPLALVPLFVDGPANARRVAELGAGIALEDGPDGLGAAVGELLTDAGYRAAARAVAAEIADLPPVEEAVAVLERYAGASVRRRAAAMTAPRAAMAPAASAPAS